MGPGWKRASGADWKLLAAILCTIAAMITTIAATILCLAEPSVLNLLGLAAALVGTAGGAAWIAAAVIGVRET